ncbi:MULTISPECIES: nitrate/nitrite transporter [Micrococcaceae]|uniref:MFS transporter n=1 Tax=Micrococcaceae TaxID=1268 RepID=UPI0018283229|nr:MULTISPECIES: MFS transporter [Micrococcaceae]MBB5748260.1 NNP family nitrate/nitrite transporter-like MFS transporter [Micrococcus sp. TA1]HRO30560.1 MFS transporter [Citricoccus sp.]HRO93462.1 MFS transporter [Citricoccus sp.]
MSATAPAARDADLRGQTLNLWLATLASTVGFWAWTMIGPLSARYTEQMGLAPTQTAVLVAMPILVGAVARVPVGVLTDRYGGRLMFTVLLGLTAPLVLVTGLVGSLGAYVPLLVVAFFLGIAGAVFAIGIPFVSAWYPPHRKGFATGIFGAGMVGTAVSAFATPQLVAGIGYLTTHVLVAVIVAVVAVLCALLLRESPARAGTTPTPALPKLRRAFSQLVTWQLCFLYGVVFGAFVAFSNYLPTYLGNIYDYAATEAGWRTAGFALAAVVARPVGGTLADRLGPRAVTLTSFAGAAVMAVIVALQPGAERVYGPVFLLMALFLGLGTGGVFGWVGRAADPRDVGTIGGIIAAAGGLGGYFPPLVMGATYNEEHNSYFVGLMLLATFALVALALTFTVRNGGRVDERQAASAAAV